MKPEYRNVPLLILALCVLFPVTLFADPGSQYCITPPFITAGIKPNLLMLIDNSASMYDLGYVDKGKKHCSNNSTSCFYDSDCSGGGTCTVFDRLPYYCFDQTYSNANSYYGYFDKDKYYTYRSGSDDFAEVATFPSGCGSVAVGSTTKTIANTMCLEYLGSVVKSFVAKGNYLNWLTASKFDVEKKILTGGLYDGTGLVPESRGCVGRGYIKSANTSDFVNFSGDPENDTNTPLGVTFTVSGPVNAYSATAPSTGGQTYINLYAGKTYNYAACQDAVDAIASGGNATIKQTVDDCLNSGGSTSGYCQQVTTQACGTSSDCVKNSAQASTVKVCSAGTGVVCTSDANCNVAARNSCSKDTARTCTGLTDTTSCKVTTAAVQGSCGTWSPALASGSKPPSKCDLNSGTGGYAATTVDNGDGTYSCKYKKSNESSYHYAACSYTPAKTVDYGPCDFTAATNYGSCVSNYTGPCVLPASAVATKSKVSFQQTMQACWSLRNGTAIGVDDINTVINQCSDVFGGYASCSNNHSLTCDPTVANSCGAGNTCQTGPYAIAAGSPALLCGIGYEGQFYELSGGAWVLKSGYSKSSPEMLAVHTQFCNEMTRPNVTDPTDAPSNSPITDNLPAILSGIGVEAQLGAPKATMRAKVVVPTPACTSDSNCPQDEATGQFTSCVNNLCMPSGLLQKFGGMIRFGAMSFNPYGSATEATMSGLSVGTPKTCSNGSVCTEDPDCGNPVVTGSCAEASNLDGGRILYPVGLGKCATMTSTPCTSNAACSGLDTCLNGYCGSMSSTVCTTVANCSGSNQACLTNSVGSHVNDSLIKTVDSIRASSWTPFSEAFYNIIGYFAQPSPGVSRTALRLNSILPDSVDYTSFAAAPKDFNANYNPSEYRCQQNYVMLISDGSATADRHPTVGALADLYASSAGITQTTCTGAPPPPTGYTGPTIDYGGNNNLPILTWLAKNRNISDFHLASPASTAKPVNPRDSINTFVVFNGESNGAPGDCNSLTLLGKAAVKGGTTLKQASDYPGLVTAIKGVFNDVAAKAASGTAASILSNSEGSGANILQAVFFPKKIFENATSAGWIGEMQNLWYFVDPLINNSTIREDTDLDQKLNLKNDNIARFLFDSTADKTMVQLSVDSDGDGVSNSDIPGLIDPDDVKSLWRAGRQLWSRDIVSTPRNIKTTIDGSSLIDFASLKYPGTLEGVAVASKAATLAPYLNLPDAATAADLINWVHGEDVASCDANSIPRCRTVQIKPSATSLPPYPSNSWKLGDIISSTPRVQSTVRLNTYNLPSPGGYNDKSYETYVGSKQYNNRGMVYVGGNDGLFHAFYLGILSVKSSGFQKATLSDPDAIGTGKEIWSFIPKNTLPYLKYLSDPGYKHLYSIDGRTSIFDASIGYTGNGTCDRAHYDTCSKAKNSSVVTASNNLDPAINTWRTVVIGGMGLGGASRPGSDSCTENKDGTCVKTPIVDPADNTKGLGYSSYFALDVTDPMNPALLWEYNNPALGFATTGPAIVRIGPSNTNGKWFAVFGSGPTGPINNDTNQFLGRSDQELKFFVVDLQTGQEAGVIETGIFNAFAGAMLGASIDVDRNAPGVSGNYQDDAIYVGFTKKDGSSGAWTKGGVGRLVTKESSTVSDWKWSTILDDIGPVTTSISRLQDRKNRNLWLFFGSGRYLFRDSTIMDDRDSRRALYGIKEPCYNTEAVPGNFLDKNCTAALTGTIVDQTTSIKTVFDAGDVGWKITLDPSTSTEGAERVVTDTVALTNGTVFFTSFKPTIDLCGYGGNSFLWGVKYDTGGQAASNALKGRALIQLSTGEFKEVDLSSAFTDKLNRRMATPMTGKPPSDAPPIISNSQNKPLKKILHIREH